MATTIPEAILGVMETKPGATYEDVLAAPQHKVAEVIDAIELDLSILWADVQL